MTKVFIRKRLKAEGVVLTPESFNSLFRRWRGITSIKFLRSRAMLRLWNEDIVNLTALDHFIIT